MDEVRSWLQGLQQRVVAALEAEDGQGRFRRDAWTRDGAGGGLAGRGLTCVLEGGALVERGGCAYSEVRGAALPASASAARPELAGAAFEAAGVSLVLHAVNPYVPTVHLNVRVFAARPAGRQAVVWFGGGMDLTPVYGFGDDARHFHRCCRDALAPLDPALYPRFKAACDAYFVLRHRGGEARGIGGIFYDDFAAGGLAAGFALTRAVGDAFLGAWLPIARARRDMPYGARERAFQALRRGRYVEFNLVWDRGTLFGLQSGGRSESILMSMPPRADWRYDWQPEPGSPEAALADFLRPRDWLGEAP